MSRFRCYINPFNLNGTAYSGWVEVTKDVMWQNMGTLTAQLDVSDYDIGVFTNSGLTIDFTNYRGKYGDVGAQGTIFNWTRGNSQIKITYDEANEPFQAGFSHVGAVQGQEMTLYQGLINDVSTTMQISDQSIEFQVLGYESILGAVTIDPNWGQVLYGLGEPPNGNIAQVDTLEILTADGAHTYTGTVAGSAWSYGPTGGSPAPADIAAGIQGVLAGLVPTIMTPTVASNLITMTAYVPGAAFTNVCTDGDLALTTDVQADLITLSSVIANHLYSGSIKGYAWTYLSGATPSTTSVAAGISTAMNAVIGGSGILSAATGATIEVDGSPGDPFSNVFADTGVQITPITAISQQGWSSQQLVKRIMAIAAAQTPGNLVFTIDDTQLNPGPGGDSIVQNWDAVDSFPTQTLTAALDSILTTESSVLYMNGTTPVVSARTPTADVGHTFCGPTSLLGPEDIVDMQDISSGLNRVFNYATWAVSSTDVQVAQSPTSMAKYGARVKQISPIDGITTDATIDAILANVTNEFANPKQELTLYAPMNYETIPQGLLARVAIDFPLVPINSSLPLYGVAQYGVDQYPINVSNFTLDTSINFKVIGLGYDLTNKQIQFSLRRI